MRTWRPSPAADARTKPSIGSSARTSPLVVSTTSTPPSYVTASRGLAEAASVPDPVSAADSADESLEGEAEAEVGVEVEVVGSDSVAQAEAPRTTRAGRRAWR